MDTLTKQAIGAFNVELKRAIKRSEVAGILKLCRSRGETINYLEIAKPLGMFSGGSELAQLLGEIMTDCHENEEPLLSTLVVRADSGIPGTGYFEQARILGYEFDDDREFWEQQMERLGVTPQAAAA